MYLAHFIDLGISGAHNGLYAYPLGENVWKPDIIITNYEPNNYKTVKRKRNLLGKISHAGFFYVKKTLNLL